MALTVVVGRRGVVAMDADELAVRRSRCARVVVDLGAGDARYAHRRARAEPDTFVIAVDPVVEGLGATAARANRPHDKGGAENLLLVRAAVESLPPELTGVADELTVHLPWGSLLGGIARGDLAVLRALASLAKPSGRVTVVLNADPWKVRTPATLTDLPDPADPAVLEGLVERFGAAGMMVETARLLDPTEAAALATTWARRLTHRHRRARFVLIDARVGDGPGGDRSGRS